MRAFGLLFCVSRAATAPSRPSPPSEWAAATLLTYGEGTSGNPCVGSPEPSNVWPRGLCCTVYNLSVQFNHNSNDSIDFYLGGKCTTTRHLISITNKCIGVPIGIAEMGLRSGNASLPPGPPRCPNVTHSALLFMSRAASGGMQPADDELDARSSIAAEAKANDATAAASRRDAAAWRERTR